MQQENILISYPPCNYVLHISLKIYVQGTLYQHVPEIIYFECYGLLSG